MARPWSKHRLHPLAGDQSKEGTVTESTQFDQVRAGGSDSASLTLDGRGLILDCDGASGPLFGYERGQLLGRHVSLLLPKLADVELTRQGRLNERLHYKCHIGCRFQARTGSGDEFDSHLYFSELNHGGLPCLLLIVRRHGHAT